LPSAPIVEVLTCACGVPDHPQLGKTIQLIPDGLANGTTFDFFSSACSAWSNHRWFCDRQLDRAIRSANTVEANDPRAAAIQWARIDREFVDHAAWVPMVNIRWVDFVSARVHNYEAGPDRRTDRRPGLAAALTGSRRCPRPESNQRTRFRKPLLYPLSYGGSGPESSGEIG
jgi:hypothetical protein